MTEILDKLADVDLIAAVRQGDVAAFGILYERHLPSAKRAAAVLARTPAEREDLVAEAFTRVLRILREGRGPDEELRPYLLVTLRNTAIHSATRGLPVSLYADIPDIYIAEDHGDPVIDRWNADVAANAFASLPERWRMVLWHTEVEKESPAEVATLLGMRPNSVAALAYRAREGLRQAFLRLHVTQPLRPECVQTLRKLAAYVRHSVPTPLSRKIRRHLDGCQDCQARADVLTRINAEIAGLLAPIVLGAPLAAGYLQAPAAAVTTAVGAATATATATATVAETGLVGGVLTAKVAMLKVGAAALVAATAVTTTAASPAAPRPPASAPVMVVDGERISSFDVTGPPLCAVLPSLPMLSEETAPTRTGSDDANQSARGQRGKSATASSENAGNQRAKNNPGRGQGNGRSTTGKPAKTKQKSKSNGKSNGNSKGQSAANKGKAKKITDRKPPKTAKKQVAN
ncbi:sigma-70 family RNA polymerase sigma factor [Actinophytocola sediminis]